MAASDYEKKLLAWVVEQGTNATTSTESDYAKGFSGTKQDTIMEKAYGEVLRGSTEGERLDAKNPFPRQPCTCTMKEDGAHGADCQGKWLRTLNKHRTCYLYVHTITHEITGARPENFVDGDEERQRRIAAALGNLPDFPSCHPNDSLACAHKTYAGDKKLPILLAGSEEGMAEAVCKAFKDAGATVFDTRPWVLPVAKTKVKFPDHVDAWTKAVKQGMKKGLPVVLDATEECPHFMDKLITHAKYSKAFPEQVFNPAAKGWMKDLLYGAAPSDEFFVALLTKLTPKNYEDHLGGKLPIQFCAPLRIHTFVPARIIDCRDLRAEEKGGAFEAASAAGKTLLLLDQSSEGIVDTFLMYQRTVAVDVPQLMGSNRTIEEIREELRSKLVVAMKAGNKFLLRLRDSAPDFLGNICDDGDVFFPAEIFGGAAKITERDLLERIFKEDEKEVNVAVCRDGFQVVVSSNALLENFAAQLGQSIPLSKCQAYAVEKNA